MPLMPEIASVDGHRRSPSKCANASGGAGSSDRATLRVLDQILRHSEPGRDRDATIERTRVLRRRDSLRGEPDEAYGIVRHDRCAGTPLELMRADNARRRRDAVVTRPTTVRRSRAGDGLPFVGTTLCRRCRRVTRKFRLHATIQQERTSIREPRRPGTAALPRDDRGIRSLAGRHTPTRRASALPLAYKPV